MLVRLSTHDMRELWVNPDHILTAAPAPKNRYDELDVVLIYVGNPQNGFHIQGTMEELNQRIHEAQHDHNRISSPEGFPEDIFGDTGAHPPTPISQRMAHIWDCGDDEKEALKEPCGDEHLEGD